jgi:flavin reductase (DIM6/NTAB) family NADH-FMN oxidoreductase RutF
MSVTPLLAALGRIPSGLFVLTGRRGDAETGMLASWVQQCSFVPPLISVALRRGRVLSDWLEEGVAFTVHILPEGSKELVAHFGKGFNAGEPAFDGVEVERRDGLPPRLAVALAILDCRVIGRYVTGDHDLIVAEVVDGQVLEQARPMVHVRRNGSHY